jgi:hypothetical protein
MMYGLAFAGGLLVASLLWLWLNRATASRWTWKRKALALLAVLLLSVPSAIGVQHALAPTRGAAAGWLAAAGFELVYLSTAILSLSPELRHFAQRVALAAVATAIVLNTIADYSQRVPGGLANAAQFWDRFDVLALGLSLVESLPLAGLAYAMATLLHRLSEGEQTAAQESMGAAQLRPLLDAATADLAQARAQAAQLQAATAQQATEIAQLQADLAQRDRAAAQQARELAQLKEQAAQPIVFDGIDVLRVARRLRDGGATTRETADLLRMSESTLRSRLGKAAQNGHEVPT